MPFKTRRQKLAAGAKRFSFDLESSTVSYNKNETETINLKKTAKKQDDTSVSLNYVSGELLKIGIIATGLIAIQFVIRFTLGSNPFYSVF